MTTLLTLNDSRLNLARPIQRDGLAESFTTICGRPQEVLDSTSSEPQSIVACRRALSSEWQFSDTECVGNAPPLSKVISAAKRSPCLAAGYRCENNIMLAGLHGTRAALLYTAEANPHLSAVRDPR